MNYLLLINLSEVGYTTQAYDVNLIKLVTSSEDIILLEMPKNRTLDTWCLNEVLNINSLKADMILFTQKMKLGILIHITLSVVF